MKKRKLGIFGKIFLYTLSFLILVIGLTALLFAQQFDQIFEEGRKQVVSENIRPLVEKLHGKSELEIGAIAEEFHQRNMFMRFYIMKNDKLLYETPAYPFIREGSDIQKQDVPRFDPRIGNDELMKVTPAYMIFPVSEDTILHVLKDQLENEMDTSIFGKIVLALLVMLLISILVSFAFAHGITKPILALAGVTEKMSKLESVPNPKDRKDEIGFLTQNVYAMYSALKKEIERVKEFEETQRYFFLAASHELKTPVASSMVLLQGMLDGIGDYKDYPKYLRKCMDKMNTQSTLISEMLEIVRLNDKNIKLNLENINVRFIIDSILNSQQPLIDQKALNVIVSIPDSLILHTDMNMLRHALSNVIMNAIQNTHENEFIKIWSEAGKKQKIRICVLNTGAHISEEDLPKLFEPFYRVDKARSITQKRSGLGLTIVKKSLELIHAEYSLENTQDGVLFWMELPNHE